MSFQVYYILSEIKQQKLDFIEHFNENLVYQTGRLATSTEYYYKKQKRRKEGNKKRSPPR